MSRLLFAHGVGIEPILPVKRDPADVIEVPKNIAHVYHGSHRPLARPLRWVLAETARAFHRARQRRGYFWERRYRACRIEDDTFGLAPQRSLDRNPWGNWT